MWVVVSINWFALMADILAQLHAHRPGERWQAVQSVFRRQPLPFADELISRLVELLGDSHPGVRTYARKSLDRAGNTIIPHLKDALETPGRPRRQVQIAWLAGKLDEELLLSLTADKRAVVKIAILQAMARRPHDRYLPYQLQSLNDANGHVRYHAALGIARQGLMTAPDELIEALQSESILAQGAAMYALGKIGDPKAIEPLIAALYAALDDANVDPAVTAVAGHPMTSEEWRRFSAGHGAIDLPMMAAQALVWIGEPALNRIDVESNPQLKICLTWVSPAKLN
jgi:HEAT repeat protein